MALQIIRDAPSRDSYTSLAEHQAQTPGTFFGGRPVLYYQAQGAKLSIDKQHLASDSSFASLAPAQTEATSEPVVNGNSDHADQEQVELSGLEIWVTSEYAMDSHGSINRHSMPNASLDTSSSFHPPPPLAYKSRTPPYPYTHNRAMLSTCNYAFQICRRLRMTTLRLLSCS